jgi:hypothetical protein
MLSLTSPDQPHRGYLAGTFLSLAGYVAALLAAEFLVEGGRVAGPFIYVLAALPGLAIVGQLFVTLRYLRQSDEFVRAMLAKRFIVAATLTFAIFTVWGFLETYAGVGHVPGWWTYVTFWALFGVVSPFVRDSR